MACGLTIRDTADCQLALHRQRSPTSDSLAISRATKPERGREKGLEEEAVGEGYSRGWAGVFELLRPGTGALRGIEMSLLTSFPTRSGRMFWAGFVALWSWVRVGQASRRDAGVRFGRSFHGLKSMATIV